MIMMLLMLLLMMMMTMIMTINGDAAYNDDDDDYVVVDDYDIVHVDNGDDNHQQDNSELWLNVKERERDYYISPVCYLQQVPAPLPYLPLPPASWEREAPDQDDGEQGGRNERDLDDGTVELRAFYHSDWGHLNSRLLVDSTLSVYNMKLKLFI